MSMRALAVFFLLSALPLLADEGQIDPSPPAGITPEQIIQRFAGREKKLKAARDNYIYRQSIKVQALDRGRVAGEYQTVLHVKFDTMKRRVVEVISLSDTLVQGRISMSVQDHEDIQNLLPFVLTADEIGEYDVTYVGQQGVDDIDTYVFEVAPKVIAKGKRFFEGRIWVHGRDFQIVKTHGKPVSEVPSKKKGKQENLFPKYTTYRELIDGEYWFPTYSRADEILPFATGDIGIRIDVKYYDYRPLVANAAGKGASNGREQGLVTHVGTLVVISHPGSAQVYLDDQPKGTTSAEGRLVVGELPPRSYRLRLSREGYEDWTQTVTLAAGKSLPIDAALVRTGPPPFSARDVMDMLLGEIPPPRVAALVGERGVDFALTGDLEKQIREAGGDAELLLAISKAKK